MTRIKFFMVAILLASVVGVNAKERNSNEEVNLEGKSTSWLREHYRGEVSLGYNFGMTDDMRSFPSLSTTHGFSFLDNRFFAGLGAYYMGIPQYYSQYLGFFSFYFDFKGDVLKKGKTPFWDLRIGSTWGSLSGFYLSPSLGIKLPLKKSDNAFTFSLGHSLWSTTDHFYSYSSKCDNQLNGQRKNLGSWDFRVGFTW